ncbi:heterokaryon incompatibility protein-domain-containing protein [Cercophora scortea]|uniref:Heterokaryon incompatibility protein-domain-containing protein n=1 Tax=Cercophora scortea TaxID=314031 RepID=A0AAE0M5F7_9PEZI|nr:heterokaryon incompatibility protein-domain-containing protein [Cercophora scortea]
MCTPSPSPYSPLPSQTSIRILILEPSSSPDEEITCHLAPIDLDADHALFPSPRPMECPVEFYGSVLPGTRRRKVFQISSDIYIPDDDDFDPLNDPLKLHPFQRYTALSYVWGDPADPCHVFLEGDGTTARFPVTRNLHQALRSLRRSGEGVRLWVDALCINQEDYEEKRVQIALMRRLYRQAEEVVAFVPLAREDSDNVAELVQKIWESRELFLEAQAQREEQGEGVEEAGDAEESEVSLTSWALPEAREPVERVVWEKEDVGTDSEAIGFKYAFGDANGNDSTLYLEGYSLPSAESPLWVSWRRFFSSPYFRRIWILQEFAMAKKLTFDFGHRIMITSKGIMGACAAIKKFSGAKNAEYMRRDADDVPLDEGRQAFTGLQLAWSMFAERLSAEAGLPPKDLATMLHTGRHFLATDPRDKVYAVLGLAEDGGLFAESVRYEPEETHVMTFIRFARLLVEQGHGFQVLLQAGIGGSQARDEGLPSWVPVSSDPRMEGVGPDFVAKQS